MEWYKIYIDGNHPLWNDVFSKVLKVDKMQYDKTMKTKSIIVTVEQNIRRIKRNIEYKIVVDFQDELQSSFDVFIKLETIK